MQKITRVVGVETYLLDAAEVAADLQKRFAASATVAELPGEKSKGHHEIVLQVRVSVVMLHCIAGPCTLSLHGCVVLRGGPAGHCMVAWC